jgi:hypothetical protein
MTMKQIPTERYGENPTNQWPNSFLKPFSEPAMSDPLQLDLGKEENAWVVLWPSMRMEKKCFKVPMEKTASYTTKAYSWHRLGLTYPTAMILS